MRKFKFMSKAVVGMMAVAMTMGSLSNVAYSQPMAVYAEDAANGTIVYSGTPFTLTAGTAMTDATPTYTATASSGYTVKSNSYSVTPNLPDGLELDTATGKISGTPENGSSETEYTVSCIIEKAGTEEEISTTIKITVEDENGGGGDEPTESVTTPTINYSNMTLTVVSTDPYFTVDVLKSASDKAKPSKSYTYTNTDKTNGVVIDLGFLKLKKENFLNVYGSGKTAANGTVVTVAAQPTKETLKVTDAAKTTLMEALGKSASDGSVYEYRSSFGSNWADASTFEFGAATVAGTTIVVREKAVPSGTTGKPAGLEVKVKIPASAKAPKVTVDYAKDSIKVTEKMQIALLNGSTPITTESAWKTAKKGMTRADIVKELGISATDASNAFTIVVRTAANGKKSASMPVIVKIKAEPTLTLGADGKSATSGTNSISGTRDASGNLTLTTSGDFQYKVSGKWKAVSSKALKNVNNPVEVRLAPKKADKNDADSGAFGSNSVELTVPTPSPTPTPATTN